MWNSNLCLAKIEFWNILEFKHWKFEQNVFERNSDFETSGLAISEKKLAMSKLWYQQCFAASSDNIQEYGNENSGFGGGGGGGRGGFYGNRRGNYFDSRDRDRFSGDRGGGGGRGGGGNRRYNNYRNSSNN